MNKSSSNSVDTATGQSLLALKDTVTKPFVCQYLSMIFSSDLAILDSTDVASFQESAFPYDIVFGHCLYPTFDESSRGITPFLLLHQTLTAIKEDIARVYDPRPVLVIFALPRTYESKFRLPELIEDTKDDYQYLGSNRYIEESILKFGYRHEKRNLLEKDNKHYIHDEIRDQLTAHAFLLRWRGNDS